MHVDQHLFAGAGLIDGHIIVDDAVLVVDARRCRFAARFLLGDGCGLLRRDLGVGDRRQFLWVVVSVLLAGRQSSRTYADDQR